ISIKNRKTYESCIEAMSVLKKLNPTNIMKDLDFTVCFIAVNKGGLRSC
ncbi:unnamed protein product, partial [marine sediment metagenome]